MVAAGSITNTAVATPVPPPARMAFSCELPPGSAAGR
jgi:hypothetical protein